MGFAARIREWFTGPRPLPVDLVTEAAPPQVGPAAVARLGYEYGAGLTAATPATAVADSAQRTQILTQLHQAYLTCPWVSAPIDVIARTVTAGGLRLAYTTAAAQPGLQVPADPPEVVRLKRLLRYTNPREDIIQLLRATVIDLLLFGDAFIEIVALAGEPVALYTLDATSMTAVTDQHGEVTSYVQQLDGANQVEFTTEQVIHISLDAPRGGVYGVSPAQKALLPVTAWLFTEATIKECFRRGDPPRLWVELGHKTDAEVQRWREQYQVNNLGPKAVGTPMITTGGGQVAVLDPRKVPDYLQASKQLRDDIISCFGVPPAKVGIIESGNLGGGTAEGQDKTFRVNTVIPVANLILEKLNYRLVRQGFGLEDWDLEFGEIDYRDSKVVEEIRDMRFRTGVYTLNRYRNEVGEPPVEGGDDPVLVDGSTVVPWNPSTTAPAPGSNDSSAGGTEPAGTRTAAALPDTPSSSSATQNPGQTAGDEQTENVADTRVPAPLQAVRRLDEAWHRTYRARRRQALQNLPR